MLLLLLLLLLHIVELIYFFQAPVVQVYNL